MVIGIIFGDYSQSSTGMHSSNLDKPPVGQVVQTMIDHKHIYIYTYEVFV